jgi:hypothetical protein
MADACTEFLREFKAAADALDVTVHGSKVTTVQARGRPE